MGAELVIVTVWSAVDATFDWDAGRRAIAALDGPAVLEVAESAPWLVEGELDDEAAIAACRTYLAGQLQVVEKTYDPETYERFLDSRDSPDGRWRLWIAGGSTWGDSPGELFDAINALWWTPSVLDAVGFITGTKLPAVA